MLVVVITLLFYFSHKYKLHVAGLSYTTQHRLASMVQLIDKLFRPRYTALFIFINCLSNKLK